MGKSVMRRSNNNYNHRPSDFDNYQYRLYQQLFGDANDMTHSLNNPTRAVRLDRTVNHIHVVPRYSRPDRDQFNQSDDEAIAVALQELESFQNISISEGKSNEAIARVLQEVEDGGFENMSINETYGTADGNVGPSSRETSVRPVYQDVPAYQQEVDPVDNMNYDEIIQLVESIGNVSTGLSEKQISKLRSHKFKKPSSRRSSSSADAHNECPICKLEYSKGEKLITLPCAHNYHDNCIKTWLRENKSCCICRKEVVV